MASQNKISNKLITNIVLILIAIPLVATTNSDCNGKAFHCVNSTHFMICVDLGAGVSSTIDSFIIPCPPSTVCHGSNHFECEFPRSITELPVIETSVPSELRLSDLTTVTKTSVIPSTTNEIMSEFQLTDTNLNTVSITTSPEDSVTVNKPVTESLIEANTATSNFKNTGYTSPKALDELTTNTNTYDTSRLTISDIPYSITDTSTPLYQYTAAMMTIDDATTTADPSISDKIATKSLLDASTYNTNTYDTSISTINDTPYSVTDTSTPLYQYTASMMTIDDATTTADPSVSDNIKTKSLLDASTYNTNTYDTSISTISDIPYSVTDTSTSLYQYTAAMMTIDDATATADPSISDNIAAKSLLDASTYNTNTYDTSTSTISDIPYSGTDTSTLLYQHTAAMMTIDDATATADPSISDNIATKSLLDASTYNTNTYDTSTSTISDIPYSVTDTSTPLYQYTAAMMTTDDATATADANITDNFATKLLLDASTTETINEAVPHKIATETFMKNTISDNFATEKNSTTINEFPTTTKSSIVDNKLSVPDNNDSDLYQISIKKDIGTAGSLATTEENIYITGTDMNITKSFTNPNKLLDDVEYQSTTEETYIRKTNISEVIITTDKLQVLDLIAEGTSEKSVTEQYEIPPGVFSTDIAPEISNFHTNESEFDKTVTSGLIFIENNTAQNKGGHSVDNSLTTIAGTTFDTTNINAITQENNTTESTSHATEINVMDPVTGGFTLDGSRITSESNISNDGIASASVNEPVTLRQIIISNTNNEGIELTTEIIGTTITSSTLTAEIVNVFNLDYNITEITAHENVTNILNLESNGFTLEPLGGLTITSEASTERNTAEDGTASVFVTEPVHLRQIIISQTNNEEFGFTTATNQDKTMSTTLTADKLNALNSESSGLPSDGLSTTPGTTTKQNTFENMQTASVPVTKPENVHEFLISKINDERIAFQTTEAKDTMKSSSFTADTVNVLNLESGFTQDKLTTTSETTTDLNRSESFKTVSVSVTEPVTLSQIIIGETNNETLNSSNIESSTINATDADISSLNTQTLNNIDSVLSENETSSNDLKVVSISNANYFTITEANITNTVFNNSDPQIKLKESPKNSGFITETESDKTKWTKSENNNDFSESIPFNGKTSTTSSPLGGERNGMNSDTIENVSKQSTILPIVSDFTKYITNPVSVTESYKMSDTTSTKSNISNRLPTNTDVNIQDQTVITTLANLPITNKLKINIAESHQWITTIPPVVQLDSLEATSTPIINNLDSAYNVEMITKEIVKTEQGVTTTTENTQRSTNIDTINQNEYSIDQNNKGSQILTSNLAKNNTHTDTKAAAVIPLLTHIKNIITTTQQPITTKGFSKSTITSPSSTQPIFKPYFDNSKLKQEVVSTVEDVELKYLNNPYKSDISSNYDKIHISDQLKESTVDSKHTNKINKNNNLTKTVNTDGTVGVSTKNIIVVELDENLKKVNDISQTSTRNVATEANIIGNIFYTKNSDVPLHSQTQPNNYINNEKTLSNQILNAPELVIENEPIFEELTNSAKNSLNKDLGKHDLLPSHIDTVTNPTKNKSHNHHLDNLPQHVEVKENEQDNLTKTTTMNQIKTTTESSATKQLIASDQNLSENLEMSINDGSLSHSTVLDQKSGLYVESSTTNIINEIVVSADKTPATSPLKNSSLNQSFALDTDLHVNLDISTTNTSNNIPTSLNKIETPTLSNKTVNQADENQKYFDKKTESNTANQKNKSSVVFQVTSVPNDGYVKQLWMQDQKLSQETYIRNTNTANIRFATNTINKSNVYPIIHETEAPVTLNDGGLSQETYIRNTNTANIRLATNTINKSNVYPIIHETEAPVTLNDGGLKHLLTSNEKFLRNSNLDIESKLKEKNTDSQSDQFSAIPKNNVHNKLENGVGGHPVLANPLENTVVNTTIENSTEKLSESTVRYSTQNPYNVESNSSESFQKQLDSFCYTRIRGRYADREDCTKFYICIGKTNPIVGKCPANTVFSEIKKQCTKNKSHCVRGNEFHCLSEGRFSDILKNNAYYICIKRHNSFIRFKLQCQNGYYLNKLTVRCAKLETINNYPTSVDNSNSEKSVSEGISSKESRKSKKSKKNKDDGKESKSDEEFECKKEGKFADSDNCRKFYVCTKTKKSEFRMRRKSCDSDEVFHKDKKKCVNADSYEC